MYGCACICVWLCVYMCMCVCVCSMVEYPPTPVLATLRPIASSFLKAWSLGAQQPQSVEVVMAWNNMIDLKKKSFCLFRYIALALQQP